MKLISRSIERLAAKHSAGEALTAQEWRAVATWRTRLAKLYERAA
jgi:hypothetical protein